MRTGNAVSKAEKSDWWPSCPVGGVGMQHNNVLDTMTTGRWGLQSWQSYHVTAGHPGGQRQGCPPPRPNQCQPGSLGKENHFSGCLLFSLPNRKQVSASKKLCCPLTPGAWSQVLPDNSPQCNLPSQTQNRPLHHCRLPQTPWHLQ